jgi:hypothetical protein
MRYRLIVLMLPMLLAMLQVMNALAAPAPDPYAILDIGPPPKGESADVYRKKRIDSLTYAHGLVLMVWSDPEVRKLPSVAALKDARYWLSKNLRVTWEGQGNRLRLTFRAGNRAEQVVILNTMLRIYLRQVKDEGIKFDEYFLRQDENTIIEREKRIESGQHHDSVDFDRKLINDLRINRIPARRAEIDREKQITVIKWAR